MEKDHQDAAPVGLLIQLLSDRLASRQTRAHVGDASSFLVFFSGDAAHVNSPQIGILQ